MPPGKTLPKVDSNYSFRAALFQKHFSSRKKKGDYATTLTPRDKILEIYNIHIFICCCRNRYVLRKYKNLSNFAMLVLHVSNMNEFNR